MVAKRFVKQAAIACDAVIKPPSGVTVLIYHRVGGGSDSAVDLPLSTFEDQLEHLVRHHRVVPLDTAVEELAGPAADGVSSSVVLTFDDGTRDFDEVVVPALVRHRVPATLYLATQFIDEHVDFPWGAPPTSWAALRDAVSTGLVTVGSHTHSHRLLDRLEPPAIETDLDRSVELIGAQLGSAPQHFAYPKAVPGSPAAEVAVRRRFRSAALASGRVNRPGRTDLHRLWRTPVQRTDSAEHFAAKAAGGLRLEGELRALLARARYRRALR